jgi:hypothetical protein
MIRLLVITPLLMMAPATAPAEDAGEQPHYVMPRIPDEMEKKAALMLGYQLNGNSMVRYGSSIDVTGMLTPLSSPIVPDTLTKGDKKVKRK